MTEIEKFNNMTPEEQHQRILDIEARARERVVRRRMIHRMMKKSLTADQFAKFKEAEKWKRIKNDLASWQNEGHSNTPIIIPTFTNRDGNEIK